MLTTAAVTTAVTVRRFSSPITSTPDSVLGTLRRSGPGQATWAFFDALSSQTPTEVILLSMSCVPTLNHLVLSQFYTSNNRWDSLFLLFKQRDMMLCSWWELWRRPWSCGGWGTIPSTSRHQSSVHTRASWSGRTQPEFTDPNEKLNQFFHELTLLIPGLSVHVKEKLESSVSVSPPPDFGHLNQANFRKCHQAVTQSSLQQQLQFSLFSAGENNGASNSWRTDISVSSWRRPNTELKEREYWASSKCAMCV